MAPDDYSQQMAAAADREAARTAAEGNCVARVKDGSLCRRRIPKDLLAEGAQKCRMHFIRSNPVATPPVATPAS